jgi:hypothetical protein
MSKRKLRSREKVFCAPYDKRARPVGGTFDVKVDMTEDERAAADAAAHHDKAFFAQFPERDWLIRPPFLNEFSCLGIEPMLVLSWKYAGPKGERACGRIPIRDLAEFVKLTLLLAQ